MGDWDQKVMDTLTQNGVQVEIATRYIDDIRNLLRAIRRGVKWNGKQLMYDEQQKFEDDSRDVTPTQKTSEILSSIMNHVHKNLHFTMETAEDFPSGRLPTLDMEIWVEKRRIMYKFWEKPMATKSVIHRESVLSENSKISSLSQEIMRRMKNTSEDVHMKERIEVVDQYCRKLLSSGYANDQIDRIVTAGLRGYERALSKHRRGIKKLHTGAAEGASSRYRKKLLSKSRWFKEKPTDCEGDSNEDMKGCGGARKPPGPKCKTTTAANKRDSRNNNQPVPTTTVLFVEQTIGGELAKRLREAEERLAKLSGWKVRIVEKSGRSM